MSGNKKTPTDSELKILNVLWNEGPSTVHEVRKQLPQEQSTGYTTVLKLLQIMHEKGLVSREKEGRAHRYKAIIKKEDVQQTLLNRLINSAFDGSMRKLIQQAISSDELDKDDWNELNKLIAEREKQQKKS